MNGLVDKKEMDDVSRAVRATTVSSGESRKDRISTLRVLEQTLDESVRNGHAISGGKKLLRGLEPKLEPEQLYAMCANSLQGWRKLKLS